MKDIEKIIKGRKEEFDIREPSEGHFDRFHAKLNKAQNSTFFVLRIAAVTLIAVFVTAAMWIYLGTEKTHNEMSMLSPEIKETIYYYSSLNHEMESQIMEMPLEDRTEKKRIRKDIKSYEDNYEQLLNDLEKFPNDPRVINAVIEYHRSKNEMLEHIIDQLQVTTRI